MMKTIKKQHWNRRGETLVEILVAILIIALSAGLFAAMYSASMNINRSAQEQDEDFYGAVEELENLIENAEDGEDATVKYHPTGEGAGKDSTVKVKYFTKDGMSAYGDKPAAPSPEPEPGAGAGGTP